MLREGQSQVTWVCEYGRLQSGQGPRVRALAGSAIARFSPYQRRSHRWRMDVARAEVVDELSVQAVAVWAVEVSAHFAGAPLLCRDWMCECTAPGREEMMLT